MKQSSIFPKVVKDMFWVQLKWTFWFFGIMLAINIFNIVRSIIQGSNVDTYYNAVFVGANIFMFVIGIISIYFLSHYVEKGVTRKDYFKGSLLAAIGLSVVIPIISFCISIIIQFIINNIVNISFNSPHMINDVVQETDSHMIGDIVQSFILTPYIDPKSHFILAMAVFSLNIFMYYVIGWLISASFYRFETVIGLGFILIALIFLMIEDALLRISLDLPVLERFSTLQTIPQGLAVLSILAIILVSIWLIRLLTKRATIKI